jgi:hypothetical protein
MVFVSDIIPSSGLTVVTPKLGSLRLFYQKPGGTIGQLVEVDKVWSQDTSKFDGVPLTPLASVTWDNGEQVRMLPSSTSPSQDLKGVFTDPRVLR